MAFDGTEGSPIDKEIASAWTKNYRQANPDGLHGHFFGREKLLALLEQEGCVGVRFYYGLDNGVQQLLAVGTDSEQNDQLDGDFKVLDDSRPCPPVCGRPNRLNS